MRGYVAVPARPAVRQQWVVLSIDEDRRCEAFAVLDSREGCLAEVARLNAQSWLPPASEKRRLGAD